ncbi:WD40 repeat-like protein [Meira miltonrushii]|uniref:WD40 repeat-like protein n=1 Tax=Meira miltonrushii TaxID=1280837 RepID=A0A316VCA8_9BASI|nr:WD40 repeat-like protein [Meira miltonrushii]PWN34934.1 WD40 repeat-like protein [Meira miltonrushii]
MAEVSGPSSGPPLRTTFKQVSSFEPLYTGGAATAVSSDGKFLFAPVNDAVHVTSVQSGKTVARIPNDLEDITCLTLTPDQSTLIVASRSLALRIFSLKFSVDENEEQDLKWSLQRSIPKTHDAPVVVMKVDPTSTLVSTGSSDTCAKVWDIRGGYCTHVFRGHGGIVSSLQWNMPPSSTQKINGSSSMRQIELLTASIDGRVRIWDLRAASGSAGGSKDKGATAAKPVATLESHFSVVRGIAVTRDGKRIVTVGRDRMVTLWELQSKGSSKKDKNANPSWQSVEVITAGESLESAGFLDDEDTFWTAGAEGEIRFWSFSRRGVIRQQPGGRFASGTVQKRAAVTSNEDDEEEESDENETRAITEVHYLPSSDMIVSVHADQDVVFRSASTLQGVRQLAGFNDQIIDASLLSPINGKSDTHLAVATNSTYIRVYRLGAQEHTVDVLPADSGSEEGHTGLILCLDKTSDGKLLASGGKDRTVRIWAWVPQTVSANVLNVGDEDEEMGEVVRPGEVNGNNAAGNEEYGWSCVAIAQGHTESVGAIAFAKRPAANGQIPFIVSASQDRTAKVWDLSTLQRYIDQHFTSKSTTRTPLKLSSLTTQKIHEKDINALDVSPNNALLLSGSQDKTAKVFTIQYQAPSKSNHHTATASLKLVKTCSGHKRGVWSVAFSPSDAVFATGSSDRSMKLWSINDGFTCVKNYVGHTNSVLRVRFLPNSNGLQLLSCASDGLVKVWNVRTEECLDTLDGHEERVWGLDCTQSGEQIISGGADGMIRFWQDWTQQEQSEALEKRQEDVEREQEFGNLLQARDYTNAVALALAMQQPRRLFELFKSVDQQRSHGDDGTNATASMLSDAIQSRTKSTNGVSSLRDPALAEVLARAGVLPSAPVPTSKQAQPANASPASITGLEAVDQVIAKLSLWQLATLLTFVRDWNTSVRTSNIAQTTLHAILRFHSADTIIKAFEEQASGAAQEGALPASKNAYNNRKKAPADLGNVIDALLPYTRRHYDRAQRILTESAMLEYTLANMDAVLGVDEDDKEQNGLMNGNGDVDMQSVVSSSDEEEESDED